MAPNWQALCRCLLQEGRTRAIVRFFACPASSALFMSGHYTRRTLIPRSPIISTLGISSSSLPRTCFTGQLAGAIQCCTIAQSTWLWAPSSSSSFGPCAFCRSDFFLLSGCSKLPTSMLYDCTTHSVTDNGHHLIQFFVKVMSTLCIGYEHIMYVLWQIMYSLCTHYVWVMIALWVNCVYFCHIWF